MTGFLAGTSPIVLGQLGQFAGFDARGGNRLAQTLDLLLHVHSIDLPSVVIGRWAPDMSPDPRRHRPPRSATVFIQTALT
jgi:hypothetical protein